VFRFLGRVLLGIVVTGLFLALLRAFNFDLFAVFDWAIAWVLNLLTTISDFFSGNATFQKVVEAPKG
jgi:hypothetical protein